MEEQGKRTEPAVVLRVSTERLVATALIAGFAGLVLLLLGVAAGWWPMCAAGAGVLLLGTAWCAYHRRCQVAFYNDRVVVSTPFSQETHPYQGLNFLLRRSWTVTFRRGGTATGLAGTAIQMCRGKKPVVTVAASLWSGKELRRAIAFLEGLPNPKRYL
ncbi:hypothetical protein [Flavonifractor sp. An100]|uniref:hypothetical protein n=1 Tax=Flavonifractor sp. An100 TaxID=1965538 RepID=UPI000B37AA84|nr:hypothetical protein [Flavonifractor sp. An100]OUQ78889.1 hypothetical protein B5E43_06860 [Flavonifractor sp. An100]